MNNFKTKGLIKLHDSMWVTTEPCTVNNRRLDIGTLIVAPDVTCTGLYRGALGSQDVFVADREHSLYRGYTDDMTHLCRFLGDDLDGHEWVINGQIVPKDNMCLNMWDTVFLNIRINDNVWKLHRLILYLKKIFVLMPYYLGIKKMIKIMMQNALYLRI